MADTYNGWSNHATWCVQLWLANEEPSYRALTAQAQEQYDQADDDTHEDRIDTAAGELARQLEDAHAEEASNHTAGAFHDLLTSALSEVDWDAIARAWLEPIEPADDLETDQADDDDDPPTALDRILDAVTQEAERARVRKEAHE